MELIEKEGLLNERALFRVIEEEDDHERKRVRFRKGDFVRLQHGLNPDFLAKHVPEFEKLRRLLRGVGMRHTPFLMSH